jgi:hypothetical protein
MQRLRRFARYWDLVANSGNFVETTPLLWSQGESPYKAFMRWSDWLFARVGRTDSLALARLAELLFTFLTSELGLPGQPTAEALWRDYQRGSRRDKPAFLRGFIPDDRGEPPRLERPMGLKRQARHLAGGPV